LAAKKAAAGACGEPHEHEEGCSFCAALAANPKAFRGVHAPVLTAAALEGLIGHISKGQSTGSFQVVLARTPQLRQHS
jgi:hypothetical protein